MRRMAFNDEVVEGGCIIMMCEKLALFRYDIHVGLEIVMRLWWW